MGPPSVMQLAHLDTSHTKTHKRATPPWCCCRQTVAEVFCVPFIEALRRQTSDTEVQMQKGVSKHVQEKRK